MLQGLQFHFYSADMIKDFPNTLFGHGADLDHTDPMHDGNDFHFHVDGLPPEVAKKHIIYVVIVVLAYYSAITVLFLYHTCVRPRINDSPKKRDCENYKYWLIWAPILLMILLLQVFTIYETILMHRFNSDWIDNLYTNRYNYACTEDSLGIDLVIIEEIYMSEGHFLTAIFIYVEVSVLIIVSIG